MLLFGFAANFSRCGCISLGGKGSVKGEGSGEVSGRGTGKHSKGEEPRRGCPRKPRNWATTSKPSGFAMRSLVSSGSAC